MRARWLTVLIVAACGSEPSEQARIDRATPSYAPLGGGSLIALEGAGFGATDRVLIGGREAPLVHALDDAHLELVVPPGDQPGDVEVVVFGEAGTVTAHDILHYSTPPTITAVSPASIVSVDPDTVVTVTGTGFADEAAGEPLVVVNGSLLDATVISDTTLTFIAPRGDAFARPAIEIHNARGQATEQRAFRYVPSASPGLLLFPRWGPSFAVFYDPVANTLQPIPAKPSAGRFTSVVRDSDGEYWAVDSATRIGRLDLETQTLIDPIAVNIRLPAIARVGTQVVALARSFGAGSQFGTLEIASGIFTHVGNVALFCCGSYGIATDGTTVWFTARQDWSTVYINTIDPATGNVGTPVVLQGGAGFRVEELRYFKGVLYATTPSSKLVSIDPSTGLVTELTTAPERFSAIEPYE